MIKFFILPTERYNEMDALYTMSDFERKKRYENLCSRAEICIVAELDGKIVGELSIMTNNANIPAAVIPNRRVYLFGFRVLPEFQGQGIGKALLSNAIKTAASRGIFELTIGVENDNETAMHIYKEAGFVPFLENCSEMVNGKVCSYDLLLLVV